MLCCPVFWWPPLPQGDLQDHISELQMLHLELISLDHKVILQNSCVKAIFTDFMSPTGILKAVFAFLFLHMLLTGVIIKPKNYVV